MRLAMEGTVPGAKEDQSLRESRPREPSGARSARGVGVCPGRYGCRSARGTYPKQGTGAGRHRAGRMSARPHRFVLFAVAITVTDPLHEAALLVGQCGEPLLVDLFEQGVEAALLGQEGF